MLSYQKANTENTQYTMKCTNNTYINCTSQVVFSFEVRTVIFYNGKAVIRKRKRSIIGVCLTYLRLDTSTKCLKLFYTSPQPILG
jgi:hypothetical protein